MAIEARDLTSHGLTFRSSKDVLESTGARTPVLEAGKELSAFAGFAFILEGALTLVSNGSATCFGDILLRFREAEESSESDSERSWFDPVSDPLSIWPDDEEYPEEASSSDWTSG